ATAISLLNILLGWTGVGWVAALALLWQIIRGTGFPNQIFSDSWVVGLLEGRLWRVRGQVGNASLGDGSSLSWSAWVTRRGSACVHFMWLGCSVFVVGSG